MQKGFKLGILAAVLLSLLIIPEIFRNSIEYSELTEPPNTTTKISLGDAYNAFPKIIRVHGNNTFGNATNGTANSDIILSLWYSGNAALDTNGQGKIMGAFSLDEGVVWQSPSIIYSDPIYDCRNIGITQAQNGTLSLFFAKVAVNSSESFTWVDFGYINSIDQGKTWSNYTSIYNDTKFAELGIKTGNGYSDGIQLNSSQFLLGYGSTSESVAENDVVFILRSNMNGTDWYIDGTLNIGTGYSLNEATWCVSEGKIWGLSSSQDSEGKERIQYFEGNFQLIPLIYWVNGTNITYTEPPANSSSNVQNFTQMINYSTGIVWSKIVPTNLWGQCPNLVRLTINEKHLLMFKAKGEYNYYIGYKILPATMSSISVIDTTFDDFPTKCLVKTTYKQNPNDMGYPSAITIANQSILVVYYDIEAGGVFGRIIREADL